MNPKRAAWGIAFFQLVVLGALLHAENKPAGVPPFPAGKDGVGVPSCLKCPAPQYSQQGLKARFEGDVLMSAVIGVDGRATKLRVVKSAGLGLDAKASAAVKNWRFKPAPGPDGKPVAVITTIQTHFSLPQGAGQIAR